MADVNLTIRPQSFKLSHVWRTSIQNAYNGNEKRTMLYTWPRVILDVEYILSQNDRINWFKRNLIQKDTLTWAAPIWSDETTLTSQAASGQKILAVGSTDTRHFYNGRQCIIISASSFLSYEIGTIASFTSTEITLVDNLVSTWGAGSIVAPWYDFRLEDEQEIGALFQKLQKIELKLTEEFKTLRTFSYTVPASAAPTYLTYDLFLYKAANPIQYNYKRPYEGGQFLGLGYYTDQFASGKNLLKMKTSLVRTSRADIWSLLSFFDSKMGRFNPFWIPTWSKDIIATTAILSSDTIINIEDISYTTFYLLNEIIGRYVYIRFPNSTYVCRKITDASASTITLSSAIGTAVALADLSNLLISFLMLCRFDIDTIEIDYQTKTFATSDLFFAGLLDNTIIT